MRPILATIAERERRVVICTACPQVTKGGRCARQVQHVDGSVSKGCGCLVRLKAALAGQRCPQDRWKVCDTIATPAPNPDQDQKETPAQV